MNPPKIFISATSGDLSSARQIAKEALLTINCHPVEQTNFEPDWRSVTDMLRGKIGDCQALIHLVGFRYGAEPDPASLPPGTPRRSYTQMEYHLARELGLRVYTFLLPETYPFDVPAKADTPEQTQLQAAHRALIQSSPHLYEKPANDLDLRTRIIALQEKAISLEQEQQSIAKEVKTTRHWGLWAAAAIVLILGGIGGGLWWMKLTQREDARKVIAAQKEIAEGQKLIIEGPKITTAGIRKQILLGSERKRDRDLAEAESAAPIERENLRESALKAHELRISRIDELTASFIELEGRADATAVFKEMSRILEQEGVDTALAYIAEQKGGILDRIRKRKENEQQQTRTELRPLLSAAGLQATTGQSVAARASYKQILALDPAWPTALSAFAGFLFDQSIQNLAHRTVVAALADAEEAHTLATCCHEADPADAKARRLLSATHIQMGDVLIKRGQPGDAAKVEQHYTRCNELCEKLLADDPGSAQAVRDVSVSLEKLGGFLAQRSQPGDADKALNYFTRDVAMCEKLLADNPASAEAVRDVSVSLNKLGGFLAQRAQPGDADKALVHYTRSLELREKLLADNPASAEAARDVSISLNKLGDFLAQRAQPGDADKALGHFTRCNELIERLLADNPGSGRAVRDVSVSLDKLGDFLAQRAQPGDAEHALGYFTRSLQLRENLLADNPSSAEAVRDVVVSHSKVASFATKRGDVKEAERHYRAIHDLLKPCIERGMTFEPQTVKLYEKLKAIFAK